MRLLEKLVETDEVRLLTFYPKEFNLPAPIRRMRRLTSHHIRLRSYPDEQRWMKCLYTWMDEQAALRHLRHAIASFDPDVVCAHWALTAGYIAALSGFHPVMLFPRGSDILYFPYANLRYLRRVEVALRGADLVVFNSRYTQRQSERIAGPLKKSAYLPCELDSTLFHPSHRDPSLLESLGWTQNPIILWTRYLAPLYDPMTLLEAMRIVLGREPSARLLMLGDGVLAPKLRRFCEEHRMMNAVHFGGEKENELIPHYLNAGTVYVSCALSESTSLGMLEAMACEVPVVVSDYPANAEWVEEGRNGFLFARKSPSDLAEKLLKVLGMPPEERQAVGRAGRLKVLAQADRTTNFPRLRQLMEETVLCATTR